MGDQDPLHIATDGQEDSQTEFEIPHWLSFVVLHRFSSHWSQRLGSPQMMMQLEMSCALQITSFATIRVLIALVAEQLFFIETYFM